MNVCVYFRLTFWFISILKTTKMFYTLNISNRAEIKALHHPMGRPRGKATFLRE